MIVGKINVTKIDKELLFAGKAGAKWLDIVLWETPDDKYGNDYRINQGVSKEARAAGKNGAILGNAKIRGLPGGAGAPAAPAQENLDKDVPF